MDEEIGAAARRAFDAARAQGLRVVTAESCTGGLVAAALTDIPGASDVLERGFVTYSNEAKETVLGVPSTILEHHGAVSREAAEAMAQGAIVRSPADVSVAITGIAGPGGGTSTKPVGLVHFAAMRRDGPLIHHERRYGDIGRAEIRRQSVIEALSMVAALASGRW